MAPEVDAEHCHRKVDELGIVLDFFEKLIHAPRNCHVPRHRNLIGWNIDERHHHRYGGKASRETSWCGSV
jgi:hypothetical protein